MSDDDFIDGDDPDDDPSESSVIRKLRKQARENSDAAKRADSAERELAFIKAGVPSDKKTDYFIRGYEGEMTPEAIKAAAIEAGYLTDDEQVTPNPERDAEAAATQRIAAAESGSHDSAPPGYDDELAAAKTPEEVMAIVEKHGGKVVHT